MAEPFDVASTSRTTPAADLIVADDRPAGRGRPQIVRRQRGLVLLSQRPRPDHPAKGREDLNTATSGDRKGGRDGQNINNSHAAACGLVLGPSLTGIEYSRHTLPRMAEYDGHLPRSVIAEME